MCHLCLVAGLHIIVVRISGRRHNYAMTGFGSRYASGSSLPAHNNSVRSQTAFENFVPAYHRLAFFIYHITHVMDEITLQLIFILQVIILHELLGLCRFFPPLLGAFVAANVYVLRRENIAQLGKHVLKESEHFGFRSQHVVEFIVNAPRLGRFVFLVRLGAELRMYGQHSHAVSRYVYLRDHRDITLSGIFDYLARLLLRVVTAVRAFYVRTGIQPQYLAFSVGAFMRKFGMRLHLDTPGLVVRQMPVEIVHLV